MSVEFGRPTAWRRRRPRLRLVRPPSRQDRRNSRLRGGTAVVARAGALSRAAQRRGGQAEGDAMTARTGRYTVPIGGLAIAAVVGSAPSSRKRLPARGSETYTAPAPALPAVQSNTVYPTPCHAASSLKSVSASDKRCSFGRTAKNRVARPLLTPAPWRALTSEQRIAKHSKP